VDSKPIQHALKEQRGVINDIHSRLLADSKGIEKRPANLTKSTAGSPDPAVSKCVR
jgi:hypothetical protein